MTVDRRFLARIAIAIPLMALTLYILDGGRTLMAYLSAILLFEVPFMLASKLRKSAIPKTVRKIDIAIPIVLFVIALLISGFLIG